MYRKCSRHVTHWLHIMARRWCHGQTVSSHDCCNLVKCDILLVVRMTWSNRIYTELIIKFYKVLLCVFLINFRCYWLGSFRKLEQKKLRITRNNMFYTLGTLITHLLRICLEAPANGKNVISEVPGMLWYQISRAFKMNLIIHLNWITTVICLSWL